MKKELFYSIGLIGLAVLIRIQNNSVPNFEIVTALSIVSVYFFKSRLKFLVPVISIIISDLFIGNTIILLFTWSGFLFSPLIAGLVYKLGKSKEFGKVILLSELSSILSVFVFFLWTNLGVVITTNMYDKNIFGLIQSYNNGLPFLYNQLISAIIATPILFVLSKIYFSNIVNIFLKYVNIFFKYVNIFFKYKIITKQKFT